MAIEKISLWTGVVMTGLFVGVSIWVLNKFGTDWNHTVVVYNAVTSIAFTAVGVLLGAKVQQVNLEKEEAKSKAKSTAMQDAMDQLDSASSSTESESSNDAIERARRILERAQ